MYTGVTSNLVTRVWQHRAGAFRGFAKRYGVRRLVYFELHDDMYEAIRREKQIKEWPRAWKLALIERDNPTWKDLWELIAQ